MVIANWNNQTIKEIPLDLLVLWTENPRDPLEDSFDNEAIISRAIENRRGAEKWSLDKFANEMGSHFDFSELPTVARIAGSNQYRVFDGNRRVALALLSTGRISVPGLQTPLPLFPETSIPCNVCDERTALEHVYRKHANSGSWRVYEKDLFCYRYMGEEKSILVRIEELCNAISCWPSLNQRYVKEDILNAKHLREMGLDPKADDFGIDSALLEELLAFVASEAHSKGLLSTRNGRNNPTQFIPDELLVRLRGESGQKNQKKSTSGRSSGEESTLFFGGSGDNSGSDCPSVSGEPLRPRRRGQVSPQAYPVFGFPNGLDLRVGEVNNLYRTLEELWNLYDSKRIKNTEAFVPVFRMGIRLLIETASNDSGCGGIDKYIDAFADDAKKELTNYYGSRDIAQYLHENGVSRNTLRSLLHAGAHQYVSTQSREKALAISVLVGAMLLLSHGAGGHFPPKSPSL